jgi:hypothetical protein
MTKKRFLRRAYGDDHAAVEAGLALLLQECEVQGDSVIVVPNLQNFSATMLAGLLGPEQSRSLYKNRRLSWRGRTVSLCSAATLNHNRYANVYLALWSNNHLVDEIEKLVSWRSLVWVTWQPDEANAWAERYNPTFF